MARGVSLTTLQARWRQRANLEGATIFITTTEEIDAINESIAECYDVIRAAFGQDYYTSSSTFNTSGSTDTYTLPADFLALNGVDIQWSNSIILTARPFMNTERNRYKWYPGWIYTQPVFYRLGGTLGGTFPNGSIRFIPAPSGTYSVTLWYVPTPTKLAAGGDTFDGIAGWEEYVVLDVAIKGATKDGDWDLVNALKADKMAMKARIEAMAGMRDQGQPDRVQDVSLNDGWVGRPGF
jgi:hypothetical protein